MSRRIFDATTSKLVTVGGYPQRENNPIVPKSQQSTHTPSPLTNPYTAASMNNALAVRVTQQPQGPYANVVHTVQKQPVQQQSQEEKKWDFDSPSFDPTKYKDINEIYDKLSNHMKIVIE